MFKKDFSSIFCILFFDCSKFRKPVTPGCVLKLKINIVASKKTLYKFSGEAYVNNHLAASAEFSAMLVEKDKAV